MGGFVATFHRAIRARTRVYLGTFYFLSAIKIAIATGERVSEICTTVTRRGFPSPEKFADVAGRGGDYVTL